MRRVTLCGRIWNFAADDLTIPATCNVLFKGLCGTAAAVLLFFVFREGELFGHCEWSLVHLYVAGMIVVAFVGMIVDARIRAISLRGTIADSDARSGIVGCLNFNVLLGVLETALASLGTYEVFGTSSPCTTETFRDSHPLFLTLQIVIVVHWTTLFLRLCGLCITCDCRGGYAKRRRLDPTSRDVYRHERWTRRCRYLSCCTRVVHTSGHEVFQEVGLLLAQLFQAPDDLDLTVSDLAAGLTMVRNLQKRREDEAVQRTVRKHLLETSVEGGASGLGRSYSSDVAGAVRPSSWNMSDQRTPHSRSLDIHAPGDTNALADAEHFSRSALAVYGWMLYTYERPCTGLCRLGACCCVRCVSKCGGHPRTHGDTCMCNQTAFLRSSGLRDTDLLYANWANDSVCTVAYAVTVDHSRQCVVITCRGTLSVNDAITDAMAEEQDLRRDPEGKTLDLPPAHASVHQGMWRAAKFIAGELAARGVLRGAMGEHADLVKHMPLLGRVPGGLGLVVCGHSLGAGVATLLALLLRRDYPMARCWAFSPPGALVSPALADHVRPWCTSVVLGKDFIPRLSVPALYNLSRQMIGCIANAKVNKHDVLTQWCCWARRKDPSSILHGPNQPPRSAGAERIRSYLEADLERGGHDRFRAHELVLAGCILHLVKRGTKKRKCCHSCRRCSLCPTRRVYEARWAERHDFQDILVSVLMVEDHMPDKVHDVLEQCLFGAIRMGGMRRSGATRYGRDHGVTRTSGKSLRHRGADPRRALKVAVATDDDVGDGMGGDESEAKALLGATKTPSVAMMFAEPAD